MKKTLLLFFSVLVLGISLSSCTNDSGPVDMSFIEGKWLFNKSTATSSGFTIPYSTSYFKNEDGCDKDYIEFLSGGVVKNGDYADSCVFTLKEGTWSESENSLIIAVNDTSFNGTFVVSSLSATELILKIDGTYGGQTGTFNLYFTK